MKHFLITTLLALTMCLFLAFTVSAEEYTLVDNLGTPDWYIGNYELMTDKQSKVVLDNGDGTYTAYPAYYILKYNITVSDGKVTQAYISDIDYSFINGKVDGAAYAYNSLIKIEIPNGVTRIVQDIFGDHNGHKENNLKELVMADSVLTVDSHSFRKAINLEKVVFSKNLIDLNEYTFLDASSLSEVVFPSGSNEVLDMSGNEIFMNTALESIDLTTRKVNSLGTKCFMNCASLGRVVLPDTIQSFGAQCFYMCENMYFASDFLPTSLTSVGFHFMTGAKHANSVLYFPEGFTQLSTTHAFAEGKYYNENGLTLVFLGKLTELNLGQYRQTGSGKLKVILTKNDFSDLNGKVVTSVERDGKLGYIAVTADTTDTDYVVKTGGTLSFSLSDSGFPESNTKWETDANGNEVYYINTNSAELYFCNGDDVELCYAVRSSKINGGWNQSVTTPVTFDKAGHMTANVHYDLTRVLSLANCGVDGVTSHTCVLCDRVENDVIPATGDHTLYEVSVCADKCEVCLNYVQKATQSHTLAEYFDYANGYMYSGIYGSMCTNEGCTHKTEENKDALIVDYGFSVPEMEGKIGITYCYLTNKAVLPDFERVNGIKIELGVLVATGENFEKNEKVLELKLNEVLDFVDVVVNYGDRTDLNGCELVIAVAVYENKDGEINKVLVQGETDKKTTDYTSLVFGTLYGISYDSLKN